MSISLTSPTAFAEGYEKEQQMVETIAELVDQAATRVAAGTEADLRQALAEHGCTVIDLFKDPITSWYGMAEFQGNEFYFKAF